MKNRRPPNRAAQAAAIARKREREPMPARPGLVTPAARAAARNRCPFCAADVSEEGGMGCCDAETATCEGSIDGEPVDWSAVDSDEESDRLEALVVRHDWYLDTLEPAPPEYGPSNGMQCRCGGF